MSETATQEEKNIGAYDVKLGKLIFKCEGGGAISENSAELEIEKPGIRINLMRIALINRTSKFKPLMLEGVTKDDFMPLATPDGAPEINLSNYTYAGTGLREGFVYVVNECDSEGWSEWVVNPGGSITRITKDKATEDIRIPDSNAETFDSYIAQQEDILWFAYSEIQWSASYWECLRNDGAKREDRMQKFDCTKHVANQPQEGSTSHDIMQNSTLFFAEDRLSQNSVQRNFLIARVDDENKTEDFRPDAMLCLYDPMAVFRELSNYLKYLWIKMDSLLISLKTGVSVDKIDACLRECGNPESLQNQDKLRQIEALYNIAVNIRAVGFANEDNIDKIGEEIDAERLATVLAVKERKALKDKIQKAREVFISFLDSSYYELLLDEFLENTDERLAYLKLLKAQLLVDLGQMPNFKDIHLETPEESKEWNYKTDQGITYIKKILQNKNSIGKIFDTPTILESIENNGHYTKLIAINDAIFEMTKSVFEEGDDILNDIERVLNRVRPKIKEQLIGSVYAIAELGKEFRKMDIGIGRSDFVKKTLNINKKSLKEFKKSSKKYVKELDDVLQAKQLAFSKSFEKALKSDLGDNVEALQSSGRWQRLLRKVSFINLGLATAGLRKSHTTYQDWLNRTKFLTAMGDAHVALRNVKAIKIAKISSVEIAEAFGEATSKRAAIVGYAGVLIDAGEAGLNFWERDYDAAVAYSGAAAMGLVGLLITTGVVNAWNPIGWAAIIAGLALGFYAAFLEDSPLERIAKNGVFGEIPTDWFFWDVVNFSGDYIKQINDHVKPEVRASLHKSGFADWEDYPTQYRMLMDILLSGRISITPDNLFDFKDDATIYGPRGGSITYHYKGVSKLQASIMFGGYLHSKDQLDFHVLFLKDGISGPIEWIKRQDLNHTLFLQQSEDGLTEAILNLSLDKRYNTEKGMILIMARVGINDGEYLPLPNKNGKPRYVASRLPTVITSMEDYLGGERTYLNKRVFVVTKDEAEIKTTWR